MPEYLNLSLSFASFSGPLSHSLRTMAYLSNERFRSLQSTSSTSRLSISLPQSYSCVGECDKLLDAKFAETGIPGAHFVALAKDGTTLYSKTMGTRAIDGAQPMTDDTVGARMYSRLEAAAAYQGILYRCSG